MQDPRGRMDDYSWGKTLYRYSCLLNQSSASMIHTLCSLHSSFTTVAMRTP